MFRFIKIFLWQFLKIVFPLAGIGIGIYLTYLIGSIVSIQGYILPILTLFVVAGFALGFCAAVLLERRARPTLREFLGEVLLMLVALVFIAGGMFLGMAAGASAVSNSFKDDGTGLGVLFFIFSGGLIGILPGVLLATLATAFWKFWRSRRKTSPEAAFNRSGDNSSVG